MTRLIVLAKSVATITINHTGQMKMFWLSEYVSLLYSIVWVTFITPTAGKLVKLYERSRVVSGIMTSLIVVSEAE